MIYILYSIHYWYIASSSSWLFLVFNKLGYMAALKAVYDDRLQTVVQETQGEQSYIDNDGDVSMCVACTIVINLLFFCR